MKRLISLLLLSCSFFISAQTTRPAIVAVYLQPVRTLPTWHARGCNVAFDCDLERNADGSPGVSAEKWQATAVANGLKYITPPNADLAADGKDPNRLGFLYPIGELDDRVIDAQDAQKVAQAKGDSIALAAAKAQEEAVYTSLETFTIKCHAAAPNMPVWVVIDINNFQYHRADYARIFKACTFVSGDFYPVQRGVTVLEYARLIDLVLAWPGGNKFTLPWIETSYQHLNPTYFSGKRGPTVSEWRIEVIQVLARKLNVGYFPQQIGEDGAGFNVDTTPTDISAAMSSWTGASGTGAVTGTVDDPWDGATIMRKDGVTYTLTRNK